MSRTGRFRVSCFLLFGSLLLLAPILRAQDLRQWMPKVGDQFVYDRVLIKWPPWVHDTIRVIVDSVVLSGDSASQYQVFTHGSYYPGFSGNPPYSFSQGDSAGSQFPFTVSARPFLVNPGDTMVRFDFSKGSLLAYQYGGKNITVVTASSGFDARPGTSSPNTYHGSLWYSKEIKWFVADSGYWDNAPADETLNWSRTLISAWNLAVNSSQPSSNTVIRISQSNGLLTIDLALTSSSKTSLQLLDILGRPVRAWAMEVAAGESRITLNNADVPSGVYFLKLTAPGVEEVRRVCIAH